MSMEIKTIGDYTLVQDRVSVRSDPLPPNLKTNIMKQQIADKLTDNGFRVARMVGCSKSRYREANPDNFVLFNANIVSKRAGQKVWYGDLDLTKDFDRLKQIAEELDDTFYFLREMDGRFENENIAADQAIEVSVWSTAEERAPVHEDHFCVR